jgi:hypothetical protein
MAAIGNTAYDRVRRELSADDKCGRRLTGTWCMLRRLMNVADQAVKVSALCRSIWTENLPSSGYCGYLRVFQSREANRSTCLDCMSA